MAAPRDCVSGASTARFKGPPVVGPPTISERREGGVSRCALRDDSPGVAQGQRDEGTEGEAADMREERDATTVRRGGGEAEVPLDELVVEPTAEVDPGGDLHDEDEQQRSGCVQSGRG
jgi:hypothetical protein